MLSHCLHIIGLTVVSVGMEGMYEAHTQGGQKTCKYLISRLDLNLIHKIMDIKEVILFTSNWSFLWRSHACSVFTREEQRRLVRDVFDTCCHTFSPYL